MKAPMLLALAALSISTAQAAEPTGKLTLACQGTTIAASFPDANKEQASFGSSVAIVEEFTGRVFVFPMLPSATVLCICNSTGACE